MGVVYAKYHSVGATIASYLILDDLTLRIKLVYRFYMAINKYY